MNKKKDEVYVSPFTFTLNYPEKQNAHMIDVKPVYSPVLDQKYPYRNRTVRWHFKRFWLNVFLNFAVIPTAVVRYGLKIEGRKNFIKSRNLLKDGFVSVANHVAEWDYLVILAGLFPLRGYFPIWSRNMEGPLAPIFSAIGGIPVPSNSVHGGIEFNRAMDSVLEEKKWLHVYAEGSMWFFYPAVRNFHDGAFVYSFRHNVPVLPLAISSRKPTGLYSLVKKHPNLTLHIGRPIFPDTGLSKKEACAKLSKEARREIMRLMGIKDEEENRRLMEMYR